MADGLTPVGVELVAEGASQFVAGVGKAAASLNVLERASKTASAGINALDNIVIGALRRIGELGVDVLVRAGREALRFGTDVLQAAAQGSHLNTTLETMGERLLGIIRFNIDPLLNQFDSLIQKSAPAIEGWVAFLSKSFSQLGQNALTWGENISGQLAQGIYDGAQMVLDALIYLGNLITSWLMPGSPPKLLPDLDKWGTEAANVYLEGWTKADFSIFQTLGSEIESLLRSQGGKNDTGLIPRILGTRQAIAAAIEQARQMGQVTAESLNAIYQAAGATNPAVKEFLKSTFELDLANTQLSAAQEELNRATEKYQQLLKSLDAQLGRISEAQKQFSEDQEASRLALILRDPNATADEKRQAQLRLEQIAAERNRRALVAEQAVVVDAAQAKVDAAQQAVDAAQDEYDSKKALIDLQIEQNRLMQEQASLLDRLAAAADKVVKAAGGGKGGVGGIKTAFELPKEIQDKIDALKAKLLELQQTWNTTWETIKTYFQPFVDFLREQWERATLSIISNIEGGLDELKKWWDKHHAEVKAALELAFRVLVTVGTVSMTLLAGAFKAGMQILNGDWAGAWETTKQTFSSIMDQILAIADTDWATFSAQWEENFRLLKVIIDYGIAQIRPAFQPIIDAINAISAAWAAMVAVINGTSLNAPNNFPAPGPGTGLPPGFTLPPANTGPVQGPPAAPSNNPWVPATIVNNTTNNYAPTYGGTPVSPQLDFAAMGVWAQ